jgi:hypothetical protein
MIKFNPELPAVIGKHDISVVAGQSAQIASDADLFEPEKSPCVVTS